MKTSMHAGGFYMFVDGHQCFSFLLVRASAKRALFLLLLRQVRTVLSLSLQPLCDHICVMLFRQVVVVVLCLG